MDRETTHTEAWLQRGNSPYRWQEILKSPMALMIVRWIWGFLNTFFCFFNGRIYHIDTLNHDQFRFVSCESSRYIITSFLHLMSTMYIDQYPFIDCRMFDHAVAHWCVINNGIHSKEWINAVHCIAIGVHNKREKCARPETEQQKSPITIQLEHWFTDDITISITILPRHTFLWAN